MIIDFPKTYEPFGGDINVKVDLSNYATKIDIKNIFHVDTSSFPLKSNLAGLKTEVDKIDIDKFKSLPNNLSNSKNKVDKLDINKLVAVPVDLSKLSNAKIKNIEDEIPDISNLATKTILNTEILSISGLETISELTAVENKVPSVSNLVKKNHYGTKLNEMEKKITYDTHRKYITTPKFNKLTSENFAPRLAPAN